MSDFVYDHTGRKFLRCAQLEDEATFGNMVETPAEAHLAKPEVVAYEAGAKTSKQESAKAKANKTFAFEDLT